jgi:hypothetical protein
MMYGVYRKGKKHFQSRQAPTHTRFLLAAGTAPNRRVWNQNCVAKMPSVQQTTTQLVAIYIIATNFICCYRMCLPPKLIRCIFHLLPPIMYGCIFHLLPPIQIRCIFYLLARIMIHRITFYCHQQMNIATVTIATKFVTLQYFFDAIEHIAWQYGHIPT